MILVAGGTGRLGAAVVRRLHGQGHSVRVLTRDPSPAAHLVGADVQVVHGDVRNRESVVAAFDGVTTVVSAVHGFAGPGRTNPASVDRDGNIALIDAAAGAGAHMILMSIVGAAPDHPLELFRMKAAAEHALCASTVPWTIVRATAFAELYVELLHHSAGRSGRPLVFGRGDNPINFVAVADVADVVTRAVTDPSLRGQILEVGGPDNLTLNELAALAHPASGAAAGGLRHIPRAVLHGLAVTGHVTRSAIARQAAAALHMDTADMTFHYDRAASDQQHPATTVAAPVARGAR